MTKLLCFDSFYSHHLVYSIYYSFLVNTFYMYYSIIISFLYFGAECGLKKMDQGIAKKILEGLDGTNQEELCNITSNILDQWKEDNDLILQEEDSLFTRFKNYVCDNVPFIASIQNFWVNGGVHYTQEQLEEQRLVKRITKELFKTAYIVGKEANSLNSDDIYNHFKDIGAYKDNTPSKDIDLVQNQWFHNNYSALDEAYFSDDDTAHLIGKGSDIN